MGDTAIAAVVCSEHAAGKPVLRMNQDEFFFDDSPEENYPARSDDPETSQSAAERIGKKNPDLGRFSGKSRQCKLLLLFSSGDHTDTEAAILLLGLDALPGPFQGCRRRCSDLRAAGYIEDTLARRCNDGTPDEAMVCAITDKGWIALRRIAETGWSK